MIDNNRGICLHLSSWFSLSGIQTFYLKISSMTLRISDAQRRQRKPSKNICNFSNIGWMIFWIRHLIITFAAPQDFLHLPWIKSSSFIWTTCVVCTWTPRNYFWIRIFFPLTFPCCSRDIPLRYYGRYTKLTRKMQDKLAKFGWKLELQQKTTSSSWNSSKNVLKTKQIVSGNVSWDAGKLPDVLIAKKWPKVHRKHPILHHVNSRRAKTLDIGNDNDIHNWSTHWLAFCPQ